MGAAAKSAMCILTGHDRNDTYTRTKVLAARPFNYNLTLRDDPLKISPTLSKFNHSGSKTGSASLLVARHLPIIDCYRCI